MPNTRPRGKQINCHCARPGCRYRPVAQAVDFGRTPPAPQPVQRTLNFEYVTELPRPLPSFRVVSVFRYVFQDDH